MSVNEKWNDIGAVEDFSEGKICPAKAGDEDVLVYHSDGVWRAFERRCPHQSRFMDNAEVKGEELHCEFHAVSFDLNTGSKIMDGGYIGLPDLRVYPIRIVKDRVEVSL